MSPFPISALLIQLRKAANELLAASPAFFWKKLSGPGPELLPMDSNGTIKGLVFEPGQDLILQCDLVLPAEIAGISLQDDALEATLFSLYPTSFRWNGSEIFADPISPVAAGPALVTVVPQLRAGSNGSLHLHIKVPKNQTTLWFNLRFTTPRLRARFELLDIAWAEFAMADALAITQDERVLLQKVTEFLPQDLDNLDFVVLERIEKHLAPLTQKIARHKVHMIGHSHIDMNWMWTWPDTTNVIIRDFKNVIQLMDDYPELTFTHSQPATYEVIRQNDPALFARVVDHIQKGRWEPASMTWVEGDTNMASGEALARHLTESIDYSRTHLSFSPSTYLAPDNFGHAGNLPQLAVSAGATRYYHHRCNPGQEDQWPAYWWEGEDGTRLLAISTYTYNGDIRARDLAQAALHAWKHGLMDSLHFHGVGDHGGGPARQNLEALRRFQQHHLLPDSKCSTLEKYTANLLNTGNTLPTWKGESRTIFEGCYTTHGDIKHFNRKGENLLCTADTLATLAGLDGGSRLRSAWRNVLFNQFHDILDGSAIHESYEKSAADFLEACQAAQSVIEDASHALEAGIAPGKIAVINPLGWDRLDWVVVPGLQGEGGVILRDEQGNSTYGQYTGQGLEFAARLTAFGANSYQVSAPFEDNPNLLITPDYAPTDQRQSVYLAEQSDEPPYFRIETPIFKVYVRRDSGIFTSFYDKRVNRELVSYGMRRGSDYLDTARADLGLNVLQLVEEYPHGMSAWHYDEVHTEHSLLRGARTRILEAGPARIVLETKHLLRESQIIQKMIFYQDLKRVDFQTSLDWNELGSPQKGVPNLKIAFTARLPENEAWYETPFAAVKRPSDGQEVPALRWADVGGSEYGIALINDSKYAYDALGGRLRMTLVRSGYEPDSISDIGKHDIQYCLAPHPGDWRKAEIVKMATGFNQPLIAHLVKNQELNNKIPWKPELSEGSSVVISCLKTAQKSTGRIIRIYESSGSACEVELRGLPKDAQVWEANIVEDRIHHLEPTNGRCWLNFTPWQVRTFLVTE